MGSTVNHWHIRYDGGSSAEDIWKAALDYFVWCESHPVYKPELLRAGALSGQIIEIPIARPYNWAGLCIHCGITYQYLKEMASNRDNEEYYLVAQKIMMIMAAQNIENAMTGVYNSPFVAKFNRIGEDASLGKSTPQINVNVISGNAPALLTSEQDTKRENSKGESAK